MPTTAPDLVLRPSRKTRKPTMRSYAGNLRIVAEVFDLGRGDHGYQAPLVRLGCLDTDGDRIVTYPSGVELTYQRNATVREAYDRQARGFLAVGRCGAAYGGRLELRLDDLADASRWLALVERAREAGKRAYSRTQCALTAMIVGLRRCGVEVRVWGEALRNRKAATVQARRAYAEAA